MTTTKASVTFKTKVYMIWYNEKFPCTGTRDLKIQYRPATHESCSTGKFEPGSTNDTFSWILASVGASSWLRFETPHFIRSKPSRKRSSKATALQEKQDSCDPRASQLQLSSFNFGKSKATRHGRASACLLQCEVQQSDWSQYFSKKGYTCKHPTKRLRFWFSGFIFQGMCKISPKMNKNDSFYVKP